MNRRNITILILSIMYSMFMIIGNSFMIDNSFSFIRNHLIINILLYIFLLCLFQFILSKLFSFLDKKKSINIKLKESKLYKLFDKNPFLFSLIFIIICWLPYIISFYPAILSPDPSFQIKQYFGIPNKYWEYSIMIDPSVTITNHHPVVHTLLLGSCVKIGTFINNVNLGLFLYSLIQIIILSSVLSYTIKFLKEKDIKNIYLIIMLLVYGLVPTFPFYSMSVHKDVLFTSFIILYIIELYKLIKKDDIEFSNMFKLIFLLILIILFRHNGIHTILLSLPLLLLIKKNYKYKLKVLSIILIIFGFNFSYNNMILPYFRVTPTSGREKLSIPFQQTARYVREHSDEIPDEEKVVIDKVLEYDSLASRYNPEISDPVKNKFNKYATKKDLEEYFNIWFKELKKDPVTYIEATINNTYGYFYPIKTNWYLYYKYDDRIVKDGFNYHYNNLEISRNVLSFFGRSFIYIPVLNLLINIGFNVWILIFMTVYLIYRKKYREIIYLAPSIALVIVCFASPVNTYFRYALPYVFSLLLNIGIFIKEIRE